MSHRIIEFGFLPWQSPGSSVRFKLHQDSGKQIRLLEFITEFVEPDWCRKGHAFASSQVSLKLISTVGAFGSKQATPS